MKNRKRSLYDVIYKDKDKIIIEEITNEFRKYLEEYTSKRTSFPKSIIYADHIGFLKELSEKLNIKHEDLRIALLFYICAGSDLERGLI